MGRTPRPRTPRPCEVCGEMWLPVTRYQLSRNRTCSPQCGAEMSARARRGRERVPRPTCRQCGETFQPKSRTEMSRAKFCSRTCYGTWRATNPAMLESTRRASLAGANAVRGKPGHPRYGPDNPAWKGGVTYRRGKGNYIGPRYVRCPPELLSMARKDGYIMEHRLVMALWMGRTLLRSEVVNHINHNPRDNRRENLELFPSNGDHKRGEVGRFVPGVANQVFPKGSVRL